MIEQDAGERSTGDVPAEMTADLRTPKAWRDYLVRLGMEAFDGTMGGRLAIETALRERMSQAAQVIACELETSDAAHVAAGRLVAYDDAARSCEAAAGLYYTETPMISHEERVAGDRMRALAKMLRARGRL